MTRLAYYYNIIIRLKLVCRFENNGLEKYKEDINILNSNTKDLETSLTYMQHKLTNLENKRPRHLLISGVLEVNT